MGVADRAPHHAPQHVFSLIAVWQHAFGYQKCASARMIGDHPHRHIVGGQGSSIAFARDLGRQVHDRPQQVRVVVADDPLQHAGDALETHAGVNAGRRQGMQLALRVAVELHEHEVPQLDPATPIFSGLLAEASDVGGAGTEVVVDLGTGTTGAGVTHLPEVLAGAAAYDPILRDAGHVLPQLLGLGIRRQVALTPENANQQAAGVEPHGFGQEAPAKIDGVPFEIVTKGKVAQHLEERVVAGGHAHVLQVVVLSADADALLRRGSARVGALLLTREDVLEGHHARIDKHQGRVVLGHERGRGHHLVALATKELAKSIADLPS